MSKRITSTLICLLALAGPVAAQDAKNIVSEDIYIYLLAGPSTQYRTLGSINAGEAITVTGERQGNYAKITDDRGRTGWVEAKFIAEGPSFRTQLPELQQALAQTRSQLQRVTEERDALQQQTSEQQQASSSQARELTETQQENERLKAEVSKLKNDERFIWLSQGGMIAGAGLLVGLILAYLPRPKRRKRNDGWA
ncbi:TIGR04211 family SH3 domain-containing protein [Ferrimonas marina]|uniref:SH3 domain protein n=1 Tax=Ferrimonas marina TaxID=299255 RepID=A0A1M5ZFA3_9GAMM|nr:TIGR04211 family SH3 domain-containing protein [Ferrimonas marina]SHI22916.1 SH3 domain protein [Ferrimonas marina]